MTARKQGAIYDKWHARVEGQISHAIGQHPEWFNLPSKVTKRACIVGLAKRIVGEIVADATLAAKAGAMAPNCGNTSDNESDALLLSSGCENGISCSASGNPTNNTEDAE